MKSKFQQIVMQKILHHIQEGVHVIDKEGNTVVYNEAMARLEDMKEVDVIKKPLLEVFKGMKINESTLLTALNNKVDIINKKQTYLNKDGKEITTINTTMPLLNNKEVVGAIEIAKNITEIQEMSETILELQKEINTPNRRIKKIKKYTFENIYGKDLEFSASLSIARKAAKTTASVFIYGETGTGKELIAQSIHYEGPRKAMPFLAQNCAALPESLLEGILFGTSKGGFTGAIDRPGLFEQANGGTLLLDEINSMPYELQAKLLRVLQEGYIRRVGGMKDIPIDVRIIATTNEQPSLLVDKGILRKDLYYRLNIIPINVPPLRARKVDIVPLSERFIKKYNEIYEKEVWLISDKAKEKLINYSWPGNVRELENTIMAALSMIDDEHVINENNILLPETDNSFVGATAKQIDISKKNLNQILEEIEMSLIMDSLKRNSLNISKAANELGIKRQTLQHTIKKYKI